MATFDFTDPIRRPQSVEIPEGFEMKESGVVAAGDMPCKDGGASWGFFPAAPQDIGQPVENPPEWYGTATPSGE